MPSFSFDGVTKPYVQLGKGKTRQVYNLKRNLLYIKGMPGALLESTDTDVRVIEQPIYIQGESVQDVRKVEEDLTEWLVTDQPKELIFSDEPDRVYFAVVDGSFDAEEIVNFDGGVITFLCLDPYKYGQVKTNTLTDLSAPIIIRNNGNESTPPTFKTTLSAPTTYLDIIGANDYMRIGRPVNVEDYAISPREVILHDTMSTTTGWADAASSDIDGLATGTMTSDGSKFIASSFGTGSAWHGPAKIKSLGQSLTDFEAEIQPILDNDDLSKIGRIEMYLLDETKQAVAKLAIKDISSGQGGNIAELRVGDATVNHFLINEYGTNWNTWHNFNGLLRISRVGNKWEAYVCKFRNGQADDRYARKLIEWTDLENQFTRKVAYVVVHIGAYGTNTPSQMSIQDVKIHKINQLLDNQIPYIGQAGDVFTFNHKTSEILKNGDYFMNKDFGARFFHLQKGGNTLVFSPPEAIESVEVEWRDRYK